MQNFLSPGVFVEEESTTRPIVGVGTSTAGFIGLVEDGVEMPPKPGQFEDDGTPIHFDLVDSGIPILLTNREEFKNSFGLVGDKNKLLAQAVFGFFINGGQRCWVARVSDLKKQTGPEKDQVKDALANFEAKDQIAIVAVPMPSKIITNDNARNLARHADIREMVLTHCEQMKDRFAILDGAETVEGKLEPRNVYPSADGNDMGRPSTYGAVYYPWIDISGNQDLVPPSGHIAGIFARVDAQRGVHKAPANEPVRGALKLEREVSRSQQDGLNPDGINVIRQFNGSITVWGARTIGGNNNADFKYISTRRLVNFIRESIEEGMRWVVFEPNNRSLWQKITRNVSAFLTIIWRQGALFGDRPGDAFFVKCDEETNPPEVRELGQVVTEIGIAVVKPAEFVIFRISQTAGQAS
jgi:phage tail sheath protein FI